MFSLSNLKIFFHDKKLIALSASILILIILGLALQLGSTRKTVITGYEDEKVTERPKLLVLRVEPLDEQKGVSTSPTIKIIFQDSIKGKKIDIESFPGVQYNSSISPAGYTLTLTPTANLQTSTLYTLKVKTGGVTIYTWSFTTGDKGSNPQTLEKIKRALPYQGDHFRISYSSATDKFFITIDAKPVENFKNAALTWFRSQGLKNPEAEANIVYMIVGAAAD